MTKKTSKDYPDVRTCTTKPKLMKRSCDEKKVVKNICIRSNNVKRWNRLKKKFGVHSDSEFLEYLLHLAESQGQDRDKNEDSPAEQDADGDWWRPSTSQNTKGPLRRSSRNSQTNTGTVKTSKRDSLFEKEEGENALRSSSKGYPKRQLNESPPPEDIQEESNEIEEFEPQYNGIAKSKKNRNPSIKEVQTTDELYKTDNTINGKEEKESNLPVFMEVGERVKLKRRKKSQSIESDSSQRPSDFSENSHRKRRKHRSVIKEKRDNSSEKDEIEQDHSQDQVMENPSVDTCDRSPESLPVPEKRWNLDTVPENKVIADHQISSSSEAIPSNPHPSPQPLIDDPVDDEEKESKEDASDENSSRDQSSFRVAAKVKLCLDCDSRHVKELCPVYHPEQNIMDALSYEQWVARNMRNRSTVIERPRMGRTQKVDSPNDPSKGDKSNDNGEQEVSSAGLLELKTQPKSFAEDSLPKGLELRTVLTRHGPSVFATDPVAKFTCFGPLIGQRVREMDISDEAEMKFLWEIKSEGKSHYVSTEDPQRSNWLRFIRPAPSREDRNVSLVTRAGELYFVTTADLSPGEELLYWTDDTISAWSKKRMSKSSCGGCNLHFAHPLYYRTHCLLFHDPNHSLTIRKYHCKVCGATVLGKENIMRHATQQHQGRGAYQCQYCDKFFLRLNYLEMHRTYGCAANPQRSRPLCDFCGRKFCQPQKLKVHIKRMHSDMSEVLRDFQCKSCLRILGSRAALQRHLKEVHHRDVTGSCSCDRCGKTFQNRSNLKIHMLTHSGIKPFRCAEKGCIAAFTTKQCLQFHYKKVHGFTEESIPPIERSVAFTFDAYSGETSNSKSSDERPEPPPKTRSPQKSSTEPHKNDEGLQLGPHPWETRLQRVEPDSAGKMSEDTGEAFVSVESDGSRPASPSPPAGLRSVLSKGSKKWLGEALEVAEEAAAALRLSPRAKREMYGFDDSAKAGYNDAECTQRSEPPVFQDIHVDLASALNRSHIVPSALPTFHRPESASLLVEAALDAAERDIDMCGPKSPEAVFYPREQASPPDVYYSHAPAATPVPTVSHFSVEHQYVELAEQPPSPQRVYELQPSHHIPVHVHHERLAPQPPSDDESPPLEQDCGPCIAQNLSMGVKEKEVPGLEIQTYKSYEPHAVTYESHDNFAGGASPRYHSLYELPSDRQTMDLSMSGRNTDNGGYSHYGESVRTMDLSIPRHTVLPPSSHGLIPIAVPVQPPSPPPYGNHGYGYVPSQRTSTTSSYHHYAGYY